MRALALTVAFAESLAKWVYLYRAVDSSGDTIEFLLSARRDTDSAKRFFQKALRSFAMARRA